VKKSEMVIRSVSVSLGVALLAALPSANADSRLWREQVRMDASRTIVVTVLADYALWREQLASRAARDDATRTAGR
jgi:hypothetical protein